jgi:hypothetical protein
VESGQIQSSRARRSKKLAIEYPFREIQKLVGKYQVTGASLFVRITSGLTSRCQRTRLPPRVVSAAL